jgi:hypothetical protein
VYLSVDNAIVRVVVYENPSGAAYAERVAATLAVRLRLRLIDGSKSCTHLKLPASTMLCIVVTGIRGDVALVKEHGRTTVLSRGNISYLPRRPTRPPSPWRPQCPTSVYAFESVDGSAARLDPIPCLYIFKFFFQSYAVSSVPPLADYRQKIS